MRKNMIQKRLDESPLLIFYHIAKTGGTTYSALMRRCVKREEFFFSKPHNFDQKGRHGIWDLDEISKLWQALGPEEKRRVRWSGGHLPAGTHEIFDRPAYYFGFVRDPVNQWLSSLFYAVARGMIKVSDINEFEKMLSHQASAIFANPQTRHIAGADPQEVITREHLEKAKSNIDNYFLFLVPVERFTEMLILSREFFGWSLARVFYTRRNITPISSVRGQITDEHRWKIKEVHQLDCELYDYVCQKFDELVKDMGPGFARKVRLFGFLNNQVRLFGHTNDWIENACIKLIRLWRGS